jgi:hypothetical protein
VVPASPTGGSAGGSCGGAGFGAGSAGGSGVGAGTGAGDGDGDGGGPCDPGVAGVPAARSVGGAGGPALSEWPGAGVRGESSAPPGVPGRLLATSSLESERGDACSA